MTPKEKAKPHSFCETLEEKCTMNYCDENGCQNRKRELVEPKQETTLDEAAEKYAKMMWGVYYDDIHPDIAITQTQGEITVKDFIAGAKWQQERMYSEEEVYDLFVEWDMYQKGEPRIDEDEIPNGFMSFNEWFEQFKKK